MQNTEILSTLPPERGQTPSSAQAQPWSKGSKAPAGRALVFDACHLGVVLRAVLFVETVVGVGAMFGADTFYQWLATVALLTGGALPATLVWLGTACSLKTVLQRLSTAQQYAAGVVLGALAGAYACAMLKLANVAPPSPPWLASAACGALLSAMLVTALVLRARGRTPAATTARLTELQSRIRPHFLFNTLNSAIALVRAEPAKAESLLEDLSDLFRHALVEQGESVTLAEEITLAQRYLAIEEVRFGHRLQVQWSLDPRTDAARRRAEHMMAHGSLYQFNVIGLALCGMHIRWKRRRHYFCSQFVSEVLEKSGAMELPKHSTLMHPNDYTRLEELRCVYKGTLAGLPQRQQMEFDQNDTVIGVYLGLALGLFHTGAARMRKIF